MSNYITIFFGSILGMLLLISVKSVYIQETKKYELTFVQAFKVYTTKYTGPIFIGIIVIMIVMFILPNVITASTITVGDDIKYTAFLQRILNWLRVVSVGVGVLAQGAGFLIIRKGEKYLRDAENNAG
jgi:hypothetical protein